ncbi:hypothetical protein Tco_0664934 [Tanacetum coccineum]
MRQHRKVPADLYAEIEDSLKRDESVSMRVVSAPTPCLGKRLGAPPSVVVASVSEPSHIGTSTPACTSGRSLSLGGVVASGCVGKSRDQMGEVMRRQMDLLEELSRKSFDTIPKKVDELFKRPGPSLEELLALGIGQRNGSVLLKGTKGIFVRHGLEVSKKLKIEAAQEKHEETWGYTPLNP